MYLYRTGQLQIRPKPEANPSEVLSMMIHIVLDIDESDEHYPELWREGDRAYAEYVAWRESQSQEEQESIVDSD